MRPRTKAPDRRIPSAPGRRALKAGIAGSLVALAVLTLACTSNDSPEATPESPSPTAAGAPPLPTLTIPSPTAEPTATDTAGEDGFRAFAPQIDAAIAAADAGFFAARGLEDELTCAGDEVLGICFGQPAGEVLRGIPTAIYQSDAFALLSEEEYAGALDDWLAMADPDGAPALVALAHRPAADGVEEAYLAVVKGVFLIGAEGEQVKRQQGRVFQFQFLDGVWRLSGDLYLSVPESTDPWVSGDCAECYDSWEHWRGAPAEPPPG